MGFKLSRTGLELLKGFEGFRPQAARLADGRWTVGYGHIASAREGAVVTEADAEALLLWDLIPVVARINDLARDFANQPRFDALTCFAFNIGLEAFGGSETLRLAAEGRHAEAAMAMEAWRQVLVDGRPVVLDALVRRRAAERALYLSDPGAALSPSALLAPIEDARAREGLPLNIPAGAVIPMGAEAVAVVQTPVFPQPDATHKSDPEPKPEPEPEPEPELAPEPELEPQAAPAPTVIPASAPVQRAYLSQTFIGAAPLVGFRPPPAANFQPEVEAPRAPEPFVLTPDNDEGPEPEQPEIEPEPVLAPPQPAAYDEHPVLFEAETNPVDLGPLVTTTEEEPLADEGEPGRRGFSLGDTAAFIAMGGVGLASWSAAIAGFNLDRPASTGLVDETTAISGVLALIGSVCVGLSAYNLFKRVAGEE
ncbi:lysozyme [Brevundimonas sp. 2R-24]|uniref:Lysozyme n=1 Tax=Peiella sedimenti TaxID=3061083 RepID=A0ABT8SQ03_9CAUL|nr:lysozyme [Caulobacteraceae bacterium XZ-24]